jgi:HEAT repeat protein
MCAAAPSLLGFAWDGKRGMAMEDDTVRLARERLTADDPHMRAQALYTLGESEDRAALPVAAELLCDEDHRVRVAAVAAVGEIGDERALEPLIASLTDPNAQTHEAVVTALASLGDERAAKDLILSLQRDPAFHVRLRIVQALPRFRDASIVAALIDALYDSDEQVCAYAALNLGMLGDSQALPALEYMAANDDDEHWWYGANFEHEVSSTAEKSIAAIGARQAGGLRDTMEQMMARP